MKPYFTFVLLVLFSATSLAAGNKDPAWTKKAVVGAVADGAKIAGSTYDAATGSLPQKAFRARDLAGWGNREARKELADQGNQLVKNCEDFSKKNRLPIISTAIQVADVGSTIAGKVYEGDLSGAGAEVVNEGAKTAATTAGTFGGAKAGALIGSAFGPIGTVVGGAIGAAGGAIAASAGYDAVVGDGLKKTVEGGFEKSKEDYVNDARESRRQYKAGKEREEAESEERKRKADEARAAGHGDPDSDQNVSIKGSPVDIKVQAEENVPPADSSIPVIPVDCTIAVTVWNAKSPQKIAIDFTYHILDGKVSGSYSYDRGDKVTMHYSYNGTIKDNIITGQTTWNIDPVRLSDKDVDQTTYMSGETDDRVTLNLDGTLSMEGTSRSNWRIERTRGPSVAGMKTSGSTSDTIKDIAGRWHIISKAEKTDKKRQ